MVKPFKGTLFFASFVSFAVKFPIAQSGLKRSEIGLNLTHQEIDDVLDFLCQNANLCEIFYLWRPTLRDAKDDFLLELAVESNSDHIITFNTKDFAESSQFGIKAIKPGEFLRMIGETK